MLLLVLVLVVLLLLWRHGASGGERDRGADRGVDGRAAESDVQQADLRWRTVAGTFTCVVRCGWVGAGWWWDG